MAGVASHLQSRAAALLGLFALVALLLIASGSAAPAAARAAKASVSCPPQPYGIAPGPGTPGPQRFTMLIRINTQGNVNTWTQWNTSPDKGGLAPYVRPQDIFVINTRFTGSGLFPPTTDAVATQLSAQLRATFPCNRIVDLDGQSFDATQPGFAFAGINDPNVYSLMTDFEQMDWDQTAYTQPGRPPWTDNFTTALPRIAGWDYTMSSTAAANPNGAGKRTGLVPQDDASWNYGQIAQNLNKQNARLGPTKIGPMAIQSQNTCSDSGAAGFGARAKALRMQYTFKFITKKVKKRVKGKIKKVTVTTRVPLHKKAKPILDNLAMELSFTATPQASASQAILSTSAAQVAACVPAAMKQGIGGFFFFAAEDAMRLLFQQPQIAPLRPPVGAVTTPASSGGVGAPG